MTQATQLDQRAGDPIDRAVVHLRASLLEVSRAMKRARAESQRLDEPDRTESREKSAHALRVACRRAEGCLLVVGSHLPAPRQTAIEKVLRRIRKAAGVIRNVDVHTTLLQAIHDPPDRPLETAPPTGLNRVLEHLEKNRRKGWLHLGRVVGKPHRKTFRAAAARLIRAANDNKLPSWPRLVIAAVEPVVREAQTALRTAPTDTQALHSLRIHLKKARYAAWPRALTPDTDRNPGAAWIIETQRKLGDVNDVVTLIESLRSMTKLKNFDGPAHDTIAHLCERFERVLEHRLKSSSIWLTESDGHAALESLLAPPAAHKSPAHVSTAFNGELTEPAEPRDQTHAVQNGRADHVGRARQSQSNLWLAGERHAVIDVGSNGIRLVAVELQDERNWRVLAEERATARLAQGMSRHKTLCPEAMARAVDAIQRFRARCDSLGCDVRAYATAAVRDARNRDDFISLVKDRTGLDLAVISAQEEGKYTYAAVARRHDLSHGLAAVVDIGGGSLEVVFSLDGVIVSNSSMPLGAVRLTEDFGGPDEVGRPRYSDLRRHIDRQLKLHVARPPIPPTVVVGCGGTFTTMLTLSAASRGVTIERNSPALRSLAPVTRRELKDIIERLRRMSLAERLRVPGLPPDRADIVVAGLIAVHRLMKHLGVSQVRANPGGVREGLLLSLIAERTATPEDRTRDEHLLDSARDLAHRCHSDRAHSEHVAALAVSLYDQFLHLGGRGLLPRLGTEPHERALLEAAGILHDVGTMVEYRRHHKHSALIIRHADLPGWDPRLQELLAQVCRFHRRSGPSPKLRSFAALPEKDQDVVRRLAGLLRVADGLDRSQAQAVKEVRVRTHNARIILDVTGEEDATADIRAATSKSDVLEDATRRRIAIARTPATSGAEPGEVVVRRVGTISPSHA